MKYKNSFLDKIASKLSKTLEAKEHFDKKELDRPYLNKVDVLKEVLTKEYKFAAQNSNHKSYAMKLEILEKHINYVKKIQSKRTLDEHDKKIVDTLYLKYVS